jgi:hypothetical protein
MSKCQRCDGCGKIASGEEGAPWTAWTDMPLGSSAAVIMGIVKPITCPDCGGSGEVKPMPEVQITLADDSPGVLAGGGLCIVALDGVIYIIRLERYPDGWADKEGE